MNRTFHHLIFFIALLSTHSLFAKEKLRVFSWDGYVTKKDVLAVNKLLKKEQLNFEVTVIKPFAEGPEQMFNIIRAKKCDIAFLTLFFIKMKKNKITNLLQEINIHSKRLSNYKSLIPELTKLPMGLHKSKPLYIPFGGGTYGFWVNLNKVKRRDVPKSVGELWSKKWKNKISLNKTQIWYNIGITLMSLEKDPFYINDLVLKKQRSQAMSLVKDKKKIQEKLTSLYQQAGNFWSSGTEFHEHLEIVSSWGPEMEKRNAETNEKWEQIKFKEGNIVWLDTINFIQGLKGKKLEAAEVLANYFIGKEVQQRVVEELSMISVSKLVDKNPYVEENTNPFGPRMFVPPYTELADNVMQMLSAKALEGLKR